MKKLSIIICLFTVIACKKEIKEELPVFYTYEAMIAQREKQNDTSLPPPPPSHSSYYSAHNFIVDSLGSLYYFDYKTPFIPGCGTGHDTIYPAKFINLKPGQLIKIPPSEIEKFVKRKILADTVSDNLILISVGCEKDTFHSQDLSKVSELLNTKIRLFMCRRITQEESEVLNHKKRKIPYDYHLIKWDSVRTTFKKNY